MSCSPSSGRSASVWVSSPGSSRSIAGSSAGDHGARSSAPVRRGPSGSSDGADLHQRVDEDDLLAARVHGQGDGRAAAHAVGGEPAGDPGRLGLELGVGHLRAVRDQRGAVGAALGSLGKPVVELHRAGISSPSCPNATRTPRPRRSSTRRSSGGGRRRVRGHPLREGATGSPRSRSTGPRCCNAFRPQTLIEISRRARAGPRGHRGRRRSSSPARASRAFCSGGDQSVRGDTGYVAEGASRRPLPRHRPAGADAAAAEAGGGDGRRLRGRRRPRPPRLLRPDDRRRQRPLRPDRAAGRLLGRRLRRLPAARPRRDQEGEGVLAALPPVRRRGGAGDGPRQHGRPARRASSGRPSPGAARCSPSPPSPCAWSSRASTPTRTATPGSSSSPTTPTSSSTAAEEAREGREAFKEKRRPDFSKFPRRP